MGNQCTNIVIAGFPGVGKTMAEEIRKNVFDYESSGYHWILNPNTQIMEVNPNWPRNYLDTIERNYNERYRSVLLVSTHPEVIDGLCERKIPFIFVLPNRDLKDEYLGRYLKRGSGYRFVKNMTGNWNRFIDEIEERDHVAIHLCSGQFLVDVLPFG